MSQAESSAAAVELAGMDDAMQALREALVWPTTHRAAAMALGVQWPSGILLHGPPGCGKTSAVYAAAKQCSAVVHLVNSATVGGTYSGESQRKLRDIFAAAKKHAQSGRPAVVFLDELDTLCPRRNTARQHEAQLIGQLLTLLDGAATLNEFSRTEEAKMQHASGHVLVVGATSRPNAVDPALRRPGRLEREVLVSLPDTAARFSILQRLTCGLPIVEGLDMQQLAQACHGYSGADLAALCSEACVSALACSRNASMEKLSVQNQSSVGMEVKLSAECIHEAMKRIQPSISRGVAFEYEPVHWDCIGGLSDVKHKLRQAVEWPLMHEAVFNRLGISCPRGLLLHGPPGCCKTTLARAAATLSRATFISVSGSQLYSMFVGEGEAFLREAFRRARLAAPSIIFLDELDSIVGKRSSNRHSSDAAPRLLASFLTEMDGLELSRGIIVMGATNRPYALDAALLRPGRFDIALYVPPPDETGRLQALQIHSRNLPLGPDVDLQAIASQTACYTGAELAAICAEAAMVALRVTNVPNSSSVCCITHKHFLQALELVKPQLTPKDLAQYEAWPGSKQGNPRNRV